MTFDQSTIEDVLAATMAAIMGGLAMSTLLVLCSLSVASRMDTVT
jgi:hypothetical protein